MDDTEYEYKTQSDLPQLSPREQAVAAAHKNARQRRTTPAKQQQKQQERVLSQSSLDSYERIKTLGKGSFGRVDKVRDLSTGNMYALKTIKYQFGADDDRKTAFEEARLLKNLSHPSIVRFHEAFETTHREKMCIVMELCHGTLVQAQEHAKAQDSHFTERRILSWLFQVGMGLEYLHSQKLLHRDIKPANIFLSCKGHAVKLGDFGLVRVLDQTFDMAKTRCGTPLYNCSPEICESRPYNAATDMWGLGVVMYELLQLSLPFTGKVGSKVTVVQLLRSVVNDEPDPLPDRYSSGLTRLILRHLLAKDHRKRPTSYELLKVPFVKQHMKLFLNKPHPSVPQELLDSIYETLQRMGKSGNSPKGNGGGGGGGSSDRRNGRSPRENSSDRARRQQREKGGDGRSNGNRRNAPPTSSPDFVPNNRRTSPTSASPNFVPTSLMDVVRQEERDGSVDDSLRQLSNEFENAMKFKER